MRSCRPRRRTWKNSSTTKKAGESRMSTRIGIGSPRKYGGSPRRKHEQRRTRGTPSYTGNTSPWCGSPTHSQCGVKYMKATSGWQIWDEIEHGATHPHDGVIHRSPSRGSPIAYKELSGDKQYIHPELGFIGLCEVESFSTFIIERSQAVIRYTTTKFHHYMVLFSEKVLESILSIRQNYKVEEWNIEL